MANIFITGSADGLGFLAAQNLLDLGHQVYGHARNHSRAEQLKQKLPHLAGVLIADLANMDETKKLAEELNGMTTFDAIIHNAGVYTAPPETTFAVNVLAPYVLTCLVKMPKRLIYLSSGMHNGGSPLKDISQTNGVSYSDSKLQVTTLVKAVAGRFPHCYVNAVDPGWVPTKMGGASATDDLQKGYETQVWLSISNEPDALVSGAYFYHQKQRPPKSEANDPALQNELLQICEQVTGVVLGSPS